MTSAVDAFLARAAAEPVELTIRDLLAIWGYKARTYESVARIQHDLAAAGVRCSPALDEGPAVPSSELAFPPQRRRVTSRMPAG